MRRSKNVAAHTWAGISKATSHEIAEELGQIINQLLGVTQPPLSSDDEDEIEADLKKAQRDEAYARMHSDECIGWDDPDLNPRNAQRVGPAWFTFQKRFAGEFAQKFPTVRIIDLDRLEAEITLEFANVELTRPESEEIEQYVTLDRAAGLVSRAKKTLERALRKG